MAASERDIKVKCGNLKNGCPWVGELAALDEHHDTCDLALLPCPNECQVEEKVVQLLRKDIETHCENKCPNRSYQCPHCREEGKHCDITTSHLEKVPCPNEGCEEFERFPRCKIPDHRTKCPFEMVACKYSKIGCEDKPLRIRKELADHENNDQLHLHIAMETILKREDDVSQTQTRLNQHDEKIALLSTTASSQFVFKVSEFSQRKSSEEEFYSPPFYTHQGGYKMYLKVYPNGYGDGAGTHVSVYARLTRGENGDTLTWPFNGTVTVELLNQLEDKEHHQYTIPYPEGKDDRNNRRVVDRERAPGGWGYHTFIPHAALGHRLPLNCQYLKDDCLYFRVSFKATPNPKPWLTCTV